MSEDLGNDTGKENGSENEDELAPVLVWAHPINGLPAKRTDKELMVTRDADKVELAQITAALGIVACTALSASYAIGARGKGRFHMRGTLKGEVIQACVVSLEPVTDTVVEEFDVEFRPADQLVTAPGEEIELGPDDLDAPEIEPITADRLEVGRVIYETLAAGLVLYPRADGAAFQPREIGASDQIVKENPFAVLAKLKKDD